MFYNASDGLGALQTWWIYAFLVENQGEIIFARYVGFRDSREKNVVPANGCLGTVSCNS